MKVQVLISLYDQSKSKLFFRFYCHIVIEKNPTFYLRTYKTDNRVLYLFQGMLYIFQFQTTLHQTLRNVQQLPISMNMSKSHLQLLKYIFFSYFKICIFEKTQTRFIFEIYSEYICIILLTYSNH